MLPCITTRFTSVSSRDWIPKPTGRMQCEKPSSHFVLEELSMFWCGKWRFVPFETVTWNLLQHVFTSLCITKPQWTCDNYDNYVINTWKLSEFLVKMDGKTRPSLPRPSMGLVYLPTFGWFFMLNVGRYTIYGWYKWCFFQQHSQKNRARSRQRKSKQPRKCEQKTRQWCARHGFLIWFKFSNGQEGAKAFWLGGGHSSIFFCFHHYLGSFMIQFDDWAYFCRWVGEKLPSNTVVYEIIPV